MMEGVKVTVDQLLRRRRRRIYICLLALTALIPACFIVLIIGQSFCGGHGRIVPILVGIAFVVGVAAAVSVIDHMMDPNRNDIETYCEHLKSPSKQGMFAVLDSKLIPLTPPDKGWVVSYLTSLLEKVSAADKEAFTRPRRLALHRHLGECAAGQRWWSQAETMEEFATSVLDAVTAIEDVGAIPAVKRLAEIHPRKPAAQRVKQKALEALTALREIQEKQDVVLVRPVITGDSEALLMPVTARGNAEANLLRTARSEAEE